MGVGVMAAGLIIPAWLAANRGRKATIQGDKVLDQIRNGHDTPMRLDLDKIHDDVREILERVIRLETRFHDHVHPDDDNKA